MRFRNLIEDWHVLTNYAIFVPIQSDNTPRLLTPPPLFLEGIK